MEEVRIALSIGNATYRRAQRLAKPIADARAIGKKLQTLGFQIQVLEDQSLLQLRTAFKAFREKVAAGADIAAVYYAGHGIEVLGKNFLVPVDAQLENPRTLAQIEDEVFPVSRILEDTEEARKLQLIILDCCRDDPFGDITRSLKGVTRGVGPHRGLAALPARLEGNSLIAYAAAPGSVAYDGEEGDVHSPYVAALLEHIGTAGEDVQRAFNRVRATVIDRTSTTRTGLPQPPQAPDYRVGFRIPAIYLAPDEGEAAYEEIKSVSDPTVLDVFISRFADHSRARDAAVRAAALRHKIAAEAQHWLRIKESTQRRDFEEYLKEWPSGAHAHEARSRLQTLPHTSILSSAATTFGDTPANTVGYILVGTAAIGVGIIALLKFLFPKILPLAWVCGSWCTDFICGEGNKFDTMQFKCVAKMENKFDTGIFRPSLGSCQPGQVYNLAFGRCVSQCNADEFYSTTTSKCVKLPTGLSPIFPSR